MKREYPPLLSLAVAAAGLVLAVAGYMRGETLTVLTKAIRICLECIGIG